MVVWKGGSVPSKVCKYKIYRVWYILSSYGANPFLGKMTGKKLFRMREPDFSGLELPPTLAVLLLAV